MFVVLRDIFILGMNESPTAIKPEDKWYVANGVTTAHCKYECDHPQPFAEPDASKMYCGHCNSKGRGLVEMIPGNPEE